MSLKSWLPLLVFVIVVAFLWRGLFVDPHRMPSALVGKPVPEFKAPLLNNPDITGSNYAMHGKVVLLNVFASWCRACRAEHPVLMDIKEAGIVPIYGLAYRDNETNAKRWFKKVGNPYTQVFLDRTGRIAMSLGVYGTPETYLIDRQGIIRYKYVGVMSPDAWRNEVLPRVQRLLHEKQHETY